MEIKIKVHSVIDVITNSSTEIFTRAKHTAPEAVFEIIDAVLNISGSDKKAKDLFDVNIEPSDWDYIQERIFEEIEEDELEDEVLLKLAKPIMEISSWKTKDEQFNKIVVPYLLENNRWEIYDDEDNGTDTSLKVISKFDNPEINEVFNKLNNLFWSEERNN